MLVVGLAFLSVTRPARASSSVDPTRISIPKGPGSIEGLGRNFAPSLASGTASYGVDIGVPPSAGGFAPKVSLEYDSGGGVSDVGLGWKLGGIPSLRRRTEDGLPRFDATDTFELVGFGVSSRLVEVAPNVFRPEFEPGTFVRIKRAVDGATWEARDKSGTTYRFGGGTFEQEGAHVATYLLREQLDLHGHHIAYAWDTSTGHGVLQAITWNDYGDDVRNVVTFRYEDRPDPHWLYASGIKQGFTNRLHAIEVTHGGALVRRYELAYQPGEHSRLASVSLVGRDGTSRLPTLTLDTTQPSFATAGQIVTMQAPPGRSPADANVELADLDGDGLPDLLVTLAGQYRSYLNHDGVTWKPGVDWDASASPSAALGTTGVQLADMNGDGAIDLVVKSGTTDLRYFPGAAATRFGAPVPIATVPNVTFEDPDVRLADMDGDRRIDVVVTTAAGVAIAYNLRGIDFTQPTIVGLVDEHQPLRFSDGHTQLCDVNGDHVEDFCYLRSESLVYWLGRGRGAFEPAQTATGVPKFDPSDPWQLRDLDGDGWIDLVHVGVDEVDVALATAAGRFDAPRTIGGTPTRSPTTTVRFADMNGTGTTDIVWVDVSGAPNEAWKYLELFPNGRAGLLSRIDNGLGKVTTITYAAAASDAAAARDAGAPWTSRMNIPMPIVRRIQIDDGLGDMPLVAEYRYRDGTFSALERTFAAFGGGTEAQIGDEYTPTLITSSTFDVGIDDRTQRGLVLTSEARDAQGTVFSRTISSYTSRSIARGLDGSSLHYTFKSSERRDEIEGKDASRTRSTLTEWEQDDFGNVVAERRWGEVVGDDKLAGHDEAIRLRTFAANENDWILGRLATEEIQDANGHRIALHRTYYDGAEFIGLPLGQVARGDATRQEAWVGPAPDAFEPEIATRYNADGQPIETKDGRGGGHLFQWDLHDHTTILSETAKLDSGTLTERAETDRAIGEVTSVTGYDGQTTLLAYDPFGRLTAVARPGDSLDQPTVRYAYLAAAPLSRVITDARIMSGADDAEHTEVLVDGLGRKRGALTRDDGRWVLAGVSILDARGLARRSLRARFVGPAEHDSPPILEGSGPGSDTWHDAIGRSVRTRSQLGIETRSMFAPFVSSQWDGAQNDPASPYEHTPVVAEHDGLGRLVKTTWTLGGKAYSATYAYDASGALLAKSDPDGNTARYAYDGRGRRVLVDDPDAGKHSFVYDVTGNLVEHHRPDGTVSRATFDVGGRPLTEDWNGDGQPEVRYVWDKSPRTTSPLYAGKLVMMSDPSGSVENEYDERQRVTVAHHTIDGRTYDVGSAYDDQDREILHTYPDRSSLRLRYNARGQLEGYGRAIDIAYDGDGVEMRRAFNTGVIEETGYDDDRRKTESRVRRADGSILQDLAWTYDGAGNITAIADRRPGIEASHDRSEQYTLDNFYRLRTARGAWGDAAWNYSPSGNLIERASSVASLNAGTLGYGQSAGPHALTSAMGRSMTYDALGRMTTDGDRSYTWDANDRLVHVGAASGASVDSVFDGAGVRRLRVERSANGETHTTLFLDAWSEVRDGKLLRFIVHGGKRIVQLADGNGVPQANAAGTVTRSNDDTDATRGSGYAVTQLALFFSSHAIAMALLAALLSRYRRRLGAGLRYAAPLAALALLAGGGCSSTKDAGPNLDGTIQVLGADDELLFSDAIGSLTEEASGTGAPKASFASYPYGLTRFDSTTETRKYANSPRDVSVGLDSMGARAYAPDLGVWTSADPVAVHDPARGVGHAFASWNPYAYAGENPAIAADEDGHWLHIVIAAAVGAVIGGGIEAYKQYQATGHIESWGQVAGHAAIGAASGAIVAALPSPTTVAGVIAMGAAESTAQGVATRLIESGGKSAGTVGDAFADAGSGALTAGLAAGAGAIVKRTAVAIAERAGPVASRAKASFLRLKTQLHAGEAGAGGGGRIPPYSRAAYGGSQTNGPAARAIREAAEGTPCPKCGETMRKGTRTAPSPQHEPPLVKDWYEKGGHAKTQVERESYAASEAAFKGADCLSCQRKEGAELSRYSRAMKKANGN